MASFSSCFFVADDVGVGAESGGHILDHLAVERLVDRDEDAAHEQGGDQVLGANFELLGEILYADAFSDGDFAGDGQRLVAEVCCTAKTRRRHKALHRAFLRLGILLASAASLWERARCGRGASPAGGAPPATAGRGPPKPPGRGAPNPGRAPKPGRPPGPPGPRRPPGAVRVGCFGRGPPGNWPGLEAPLGVL